MPNLIIDAALLEVCEFLSARDFSKDRVVASVQDGHWILAQIAELITNDEVDFADALVIGRVAHIFRLLEIGWYKYGTTLPADEYSEWPATQTDALLSDFSDIMMCITPMRPLNQAVH